MAEPAHVRRMQKALDNLSDVPDPLDRLSEVRRALLILEAIEAASVSDARAAGATWSEIGAIYGLSKQGAQQRFRAPKPTA